MITRDLRNAAKAGAMGAAALASAAAAAPMPAPVDARDWDGSEGEAQTMTMKPVGPVAKAFVESKSKIDIIMGPYGSAKTTSCLQKILLITMMQTPGKDGVRRSRGCVVRDTYDQLKSNVMKDFFSWFPKTKDNFNGDTNDSKIRIEVPNFGMLEIEILWRALSSDTKPEKLFKGMQLTWLWLNEADTLQPAVVKYGFPRLGRYPAAKDGGCRHSCMFFDLNAPEVTNWVYDIAVNENLPISKEELEQMQAEQGANFRVTFHRQPGGLSPNAENIANLPKGYYQGLKLTLDEHEQKRFIHNEFGAVRSGQPVFPQFRDDLHVAKEPIKANPNLPLFCGIDGGATPAAIFGQKDHDGKLLVIAELVVFLPDDEKKILEKMGPVQFGETYRRFVDDNFPDVVVAEPWGDPAIFTGDYGHAEDVSWAQKFSQAANVRIRPSPVKGNLFSIRHANMVARMVRDNLPFCGMLLSPACPWLRQGFNNGYTLPKTKLSDGTKALADKPDKRNPFGHAQDALQYLEAGVSKASNSIEDIDRRAKARKRGAGVKRTGYAGALR
tara:strand:+ start:8382 stop:10043 length:1662 start_codon:yes stop_codon:yes gene_type:complete